jgi:hypothetical protein
MGDDNLTIFAQTFREHQQLINLIEKLGEALSRLPSDVEWGDSQWSPDLGILDFIQIQALSLQHAKQSTAQGFYRDAYHLIRMPFEAYFLLRLISTCDKYPVRRKITRGKSDSSLGDAKKRAIQNAKKTFGNRLIKIYEEGNNILVAVVKGVPVADEKGNDTGIILPFYYGAWQQYRPVEHHLKGKSPQKKLSTSRFLQGDWAGTPKSSKTQADETHSQLHRWFLTFDRVLENLRLNGVLNKKTTTRVLVHYNFLSNFSHSTSDTIKSLPRLQNLYMIGGSGTLYSHYDNELALLYICHLLSMYLEHAMYYLTKWRCIQVKNPELYHDLCQEVEEAFGYFWFIFNKPHQYDRFAHANRKCNYTKKIFYRPEDIRLGDVRYYENPLYRLKQMHQSQRELTTGNVYNSPFPRDDALI